MEIEVLSVSACRNPDYYLEVDHALYYLTADRAGVWYGDGASLLDFTGEVLAEQLRAAFSGLSFDGSTRHVQTPKGRNRQPAWDMTFSAPKSVSVLWSVLGAADRHKIEALLMQATKRAVDYLDAKALFTRRGKGGERVEHAKGVYALCPHGTSRSQDPQLHIHALAMNMCVREDGTTGTIRSKDIYLHKMVAGALFRLELASLLSKELGLKIKADEWSFKLSGVPQSLCDEQSKRRQVIEQIAKEEGWESPQLMAELAIKTRSAKGVVSMPECTREWLEAGEKHGFGRQQAEQLLDAAMDSVSSGLATRLTSDARDKLLREALSNSIESLSSSQSYFSERELLQKVAVSLQASELDATDVIEAVEDALDGFQHRVELTGQDYRYYATEETLASERELLTIAEKGRRKGSHPVSDKVLAKAKKTVEERLSKQIGVAASLTFDQDTALIHATQEPGSIKPIQGYAGTGKTQMLEAANLAWQQSGYEVLGTALSGKAAAGLESASGMRSVTLSKLMLSLLPELTRDELRKCFPESAATTSQGAYYEGYRTKAWMKNPLGEALKQMERDYKKRNAIPSYSLTEKSILVVDEAGMVPTKLMLRIMQQCDKVGAKLILIGDSLQLPPIEAGGPFVSLCDRLGCQYLTTVVRQRQEWMRNATYALIQNEPRLALDLYAANDSLRLEKSHKAAISHLIADYGKLSAADFNTSLALTSTRAEAAQINAGLQQRRLAAGQLKGKTASLKNGERIHLNDRILFTRNDYRLGLRNGMLGTVASIHQPQWRGESVRVEVKLDAPTLPQGSSKKVDAIVVDLDKYSSLQLGYAVTTHKAQGATVKSSYVLLGESMLNKEMAFTQLTRASHSTVIYSAEAQLGNSLESLASRLSYSSSKDLANDHKIVIQSEARIEKRQVLLQETLSRLASGTSKELVSPTAYLADARFATNQTGALWLLIAEYSKLVNADFSKTIAVVSNANEARRVNNGVQEHRKAAQQLSVDSVEIRQGERVHRGDRILITTNNDQGVPTTQIGTALDLPDVPFNAVMKPGGEVAYSANPPWLTVELDPKERAGQSAEPKERILISGRDFDKLQLGYAATADRLKDIKIESSLVLLPEQRGEPHEIAIQLTRATKDVSLFGEQSHYGPILDAGRGKEAFERSFEAPKPEGPQERSQTLLDRYRQVLEEQQRAGMEQNEQSQLSRQQSFHL
ncbi:MobF family relaxase [Aeoliella sp. SH292]|uniref:MobF family relaxase n=1 Tax=Aeoliella sp. SH292 TaxID=3454464 RepID=UPI003F970B6C